MAKNTNATRGGGAGMDTTDRANNTTEAQVTRLLDVLKKGAVSTLDARRELDILHPAGWVKNLRKLGCNIKAVWANSQTECDRFYRLGKYVLSIEGADHA